MRLRVVSNTRRKQTLVLTDHLEQHAELIDVAERLIVHNFGPFDHQHEPDSDDQRPEIPSELLAQMEG